MVCVCFSFSHGDLSVGVWDVSAVSTPFNSSNSSPPHPHPQTPSSLTFPPNNRARAWARGFLDAPAVAAAVSAALRETEGADCPSVAAAALLLLLFAGGRVEGGVGRGALPPPPLGAGCEGERGAPLGVAAPLVVLK